MSVQLPYNPNPHPPGHQPIPVWIPPPPGYPLPPPPPPPPLQGYACVKWTHRSLPPKPFVQPTNTTFHLFPYLPPELRLRIWSFTAPTTRVIELRSWGTSRYAPIKITAHPHLLPSIFRICKESRLEAHRLYRPINIGVSAAVKLPTRSYVPWKYHPTNPAADPSMTVGTAPLPYSEPYPPVKVMVNWERDVFYFGPEFQPCHLLEFFTAQDGGFELASLQRLALGHKLFAGDSDGRWDFLRMVLYSLKRREEFRELMVVPDDERNALVDRWYYGKHEVELREPEWGYSLRPDGGREERGFVEGLGVWFEKWWNAPTSLSLPPSSQASSSHVSVSHNSSGATTVTISKSASNANLLDPTNFSPTSNAAEDDDMTSVGTLTSDEDAMVPVRVAERGRRPPEVSMKSVRRNGKRMAEFKDGIWEIQKAIGDMRVWKTWTPPEEML